MSVELEDAVLVLDAGTGIRPLGRTLVGTDKQIIVVLSHVHSDHIYGFPFFEPLYEAGREIFLLDYRLGDRCWSLLELLDGVHFPVNAQELPSRCTRVRDDGRAFLAAYGFDVERLAMNHPGTATGFRIEHAGRVFVYMPDNELEAPALTTTSTNDEFVAFCRGADVLCHDAQYLAADMPLKHGWGHSLVEQVCRLAAAADVKHLVLFHHDPARTDEALDHLGDDACRHLANTGMICTVAREGLTIEL